MSNALAVATVTQALALLIESNLGPEMDIAVKVETRKPPSEPPSEPTITVFLYQVTPNAAMRNNDLPTRAADGTLRNRAAAPLDLHYVISAYGEETELVGQRLLGCVIRTLHEIPVLPKEWIELAAERPYLAGSDLADSMQKVRFTPTVMDVDETSKLWECCTRPLHPVGGLPGVAGGDRGPRSRSRRSRWSNAQCGCSRSGRRGTGAARADMASAAPAAPLPLRSRRARTSPVGPRARGLRRRRLRRRRLRLRRHPSNPGQDPGQNTRQVHQGRLRASRSASSPQGGRERYADAGRQGLSRSAEHGGEDMGTYEGAGRSEDRDAAAQGRALLAAVHAVLARVDTHAGRATRGSGPAGTAGATQPAPSGDRARTPSPRPASRPSPAPGPAPEPPAPSRPRLPAPRPSRRSSPASASARSSARSSCWPRQPSWSPPRPPAAPRPAGTRSVRTPPSRSPSPRSTIRTGALLPRLPRCGAGASSSSTTRPG
ncbi:DUF4255 domain-containing protein [Streptomyces sp. M10(2022)]